MFADTAATVRASARARNMVGVGWLLVCFWSGGDPKSDDEGSESEMIAEEWSATVGGCLTSTIKIRGGVCV